MDKDYMDKIEEAFVTLQKGRIYRVLIDDAEKTLIEKALERSFGNKILAAKILGINRNTIRTKIKKLNIDVTKYKI
jgi:DNA-binding protein Fis